MLSLEPLRARVRNGFRPFTLYLSDGRKLPVPHPEFIIVGRRLVIVINDQDIPNYVDPLHIVSIEDQQPPVETPHE